jgi:hypothetical protein
VAARSPGASRRNGAPEPGLRFLTSRSVARYTGLAPLAEVLDPAPGTDLTCDISRHGRGFTSLPWRRCREPV